MRTVKQVRVHYADGCEQVANFNGLEVACEMYGENGGGLLSAGEIGKDEWIDSLAKEVHGPKVPQFVDEESREREVLRRLQQNCNLPAVWEYPGYINIYQEAGNWACGIGEEGWSMTFNKKDGTTGEAIDLKFCPGSNDYQRIAETIAARVANGPGHMFNVAPSVMAYAKARGFEPEGTGGGVDYMVRKCGHGVFVVAEAGDMGAPESLETEADVFFYPNADDWTQGPVASWKGFREARSAYDWVVNAFRG